MTSVTAMALMAWGCSGSNDSDAEPGGSAAKAPSRAAPETEKQAPPPAGEAGKPAVIIDTSLGKMTAELWPDKAPETVANFLQYVDDEHFNGLIFHRVISGFMIQGGGFDPRMKHKASRKPIRNEARADTPNRRGTLAMARTGQVDSATAQFFINLADNDFLDHKGKTPQTFGYCAFGKVLDGLDVLDRIGQAKTATREGHDDVPVEAVIIRSIRRAEKPS